MAAYLLAPTDGSYELEKLGLTYYNQEFPKASAYLEPGAFGPLGDWGAAAGALMSHCALIGALRDTLSARLTQLGMDQLYRDIELPLCPVLAEMEQAGFPHRPGSPGPVRPGAGRWHRPVGAGHLRPGRGGHLQHQLHQQLGRVLFEKLGLPPVKKTKTGWSTNAEVLDKLGDSTPSSTVSWSTGS